MKNFGRNRQANTPRATYPHRRASSVYISIKRIPRLIRSTISKHRPCSLEIKTIQEIAQERDRKSLYYFHRKKNSSYFSKSTWHQKGNWHAINSHSQFHETTSFSASARDNASSLVWHSRPQRTRLANEIIHPPGLQYPGSNVAPFFGCVRNCNCNRTGSGYPGGYSVEIYARRFVVDARHVKLRALCRQFLSSNIEAQCRESCQDNTETSS